MLTVQQISDCVHTASLEYPLRKVELFGSYANGKSTSQSDVDLLVEFTQPRVSLLTLSSLKYRMEELLKTDVDIVHGPLPEGSLLEIDRRIPLYGAYGRLRDVSVQVHVYAGAGMPQGVLAGPEQAGSGTGR